MTSIPPLDADLLRRYDKSGPRYTSYPAAPQFHTGFGEAHFRAAARRSNSQLIPRQLSLYVHVPYCFSPCFYCGCNRVITRDATRSALYLERLVREIELVAPLFARDRDVVQLHFGGGTPNFLTPAQLASVIDSLGRQFHFAAAAERDFSIELDPRFITPAQIAELAAAGFNRASLGVQDLDPEVQRAVNRVQSVEQTLGTIAACRASGLRSVNVDLIYGLPKQTLAGFGRTLDTILAARPDRLAVYGYAHLPKMFKAQRQIESADLPDAEAKLALLQLAIERLTRAGYEYIGMDHFALPEDELARAQANGSLHRNFMGYTTHADCDLIGLGVSAISHIGSTFSQNPRDLAGWEIALDVGRIPVWRGMRTDADDELRAEIIQSLMCHGSIDIREIEHRFDIDFAAYFADALHKLDPLRADGLVTLEPARIAATPRGRLLVRIIAACFDRYLQAAAATERTPTYSRVV
ncbi:MAG: oxygen-independent coproporphyrinogen III oxidase [Pseudomonadota bacterium]